jgi:hypothetical protein
MMSQNTNYAQVVIDNHRRHLIYMRKQIESPRASRRFRECEKIYRVMPLIIRSRRQLLSSNQILPYAQTLKNKHITMTTRFDPIQATAFIGLGVAASVLASRTVLKYKPDKVWKHIKQGECRVGFKSFRSKQVLTMNACGCLLVENLRMPCVMVFDDHMLTLKLFPHRWKVWRDQQAYSRLSG